MFVMSSAAGGGGLPLFPETRPEQPTKPKLAIARANKKMTKAILHGPLQVSVFLAQRLACSSGREGVWPECKSTQVLEVLIVLKLLILLKVCAGQCEDNNWSVGQKWGINFVVPTGSAPNSYTQESTGPARPGRLYSVRSIGVYEESPNLLLARENNAG